MGKQVPGAEELFRRDSRARSRDEYDVGGADGKLGTATRVAVKAMQVKLGLPADSYPTPELIARLRGTP